MFMVLSSCMKIVVYNEMFLSATMSILDYSSLVLIRDQQLVFMCWWRGKRQKQVNQEADGSTYERFIIDEGKCQDNLFKSIQFQQLCNIYIYILT